MNPVARGDLRARAASATIRTTLTVYLGILAVLAFLSVPPDLGRLEDLRGEGLLLAYFVVQMALGAYVTSAVACGEITVDGEKSVWDLAVSPFSGATVALGKLVSTALFATVLFALATPFALMVAGLRGEGVWEALRPAVVSIPAATVLGSLATLYAAVIDADFARSFVHWTTLLGVIVGAAMLPAPFALLSPVRALGAAVSQGLGPPVLAAAAGYALVAIAAAVATSRRVRIIRSLLRTPPR